MTGIVSFSVGDDSTYMAVSSALITKCIKSFLTQYRGLQQFPLNFKHNMYVCMYMYSYVYTCMYILILYYHIYIYMYIYIYIYEVLEHVFTHYGFSDNPISSSYHAATAY